MKKQRAKSTELVPISNALEGFEQLFDKAESEDSSGVWAEPQLYLLPVCVPQDKHADRFRAIRITETIKIGDRVKTRSFKVNPDPELGLPGSFELEVMTGLYRLADIQSTNKGTPEFIELGSFRSFLAQIGKPYSGKYVCMVKEALKRLMATMCISEGFFYSKPRDLYIVESFSFISSLEFAGETDFTGTRYERNRVKLHEFIRENLNANFRTLIDFDYLRSLKTDIAKPLSLHIAYRLFKNKSSEWIPDYDWLAERLAIKCYSDTRRAKEQFKSALTELQRTGFIERFEWMDRKIKILAGPRLIQMHQRRVIAKDSWLTHQKEKIRAEQLITATPARTDKERSRQEAFDPLATICTKFAAYGWAAVAPDALNRGFTEQTLIVESGKRGHKLKS